MGSYGRAKNVSTRPRSAIKKPRRSLLGLWADLNTHITEDDIAEARRQMWGILPRDINYERGARYSHYVAVSGKLRILTRAEHLLMKAS